jgi:hypothetical protein
MAYFALRCFSPEMTKYIIIALNAVLVVFGLVHWGRNYCLNVVAGLYGNIRDYYLLTAYSEESLAIMYDSPIAFYAMAGIIQIAVSVFAVLILLGIFGQTNKIWWARVLIVLLVFDFGLNFFIAVSNSTLATYYSSAFKTYLSYSLDFLESIQDPNLKSFAKSVRDFVKLSIAEAIITFVIAIPSISMIILGLTDQLLNENTVE